MEIRLKWQCNKCKDIVTSYSSSRHDMNFCKCGESAVDLEEHYQRSLGSSKDIKREQKINGKWVVI